MVHRVVCHGALLLVSVVSVDLSVGDSIKLGRLSVEVSCGSTDCLSCRGKQSTTL